MNNPTKIMLLGLSALSTLSVHAMEPIPSQPNKIDVVHPTIHYADKNGATPLHYAVVNNNVQITQLLIEHKADVNKQANSGATPLHNAMAKPNNSLVITALCQAGADTSILDIHHQTSLIHAINCGHIENVKTLLEFLSHTQERK